METSVENKNLSPLNELYNTYFTGSTATQMIFRQMIPLFSLPYLIFESNSVNLGDFTKLYIPDVPVFPVRNCMQNSILIRMELF